MKQHLLYILSICLLLFVAASCQDDTFFSSQGVLPKGECTVQATVDFQSFGEALKTRAVGEGGTVGTAIRTIDNLCMLAYDIEGNLVNSRYLSSDQFDVTSVGRQTGLNEPTEPRDATLRATFSLKVAYGHFYIYVVANMGDIAAAHNDEVRTVDGLKNIRLTWNAENIPANNQMFGFFTTDGSSVQDVINQEAPLLEISETTTSLKAWIKRAASKVTVAFDGSNLREDVYIYLKSIAIKDIPRQCLLGAKNTPGEDDEEVGEVLLSQGESITYEMTETNYTRITSGNPKHGSHTFDAPALFFYENMQGTGDDKRQDVDGDGQIDDPDASERKDNKPYGTYIEVKAHYVNNNTDKNTEGEITYRFMLGKDVLNDYNAERNHHYKLTLKFNHNANDVDWHIEYPEEPGIYTPPEYFISYGYNEKMLYPIRFVGNLSGDVKVEIIENPWYPDTQTVGAYPTTVTYPNGNKNSVGFLTLYDSDYNSKDNVLGTASDFAEFESVMKANWTTNHKDGVKTYSARGDAEGEINEIVDGQEYLMQIPLYTRPKNFTTWSGYTGQNPHIHWQRIAKLRISATIDGKPVSKEVSLRQVRRIVNPTGVWRKHDSDASFTVTVKVKMDNEGADYTNLTSEGGWTARIAGQTTADQWFEIEGSYPEVSKTNESKNEIVGKTGSSIVFSIKPKGTITQEQVRCGIVDITYHNNTCIHRVFVRQGYAPLQMVDGSAYWHTYNMYSKSVETQSPVEEGSKFRYDNWEGIIEDNDYTYGVGVGVDVDKELFTLADGKTKTWNNIAHYAHTHTINGTTYTKHNTFGNPTISPFFAGKTVRVARYKDFEALQADRFGIAYGVLYADGAGYTQNSLENAYRYRRGGAGDKGMRGCFVYDKTTGANIFFPIGGQGHGRRKDDFAKEVGRAVLRYANRSPKDIFPDPLHRPMFHDIHESRGAIYWLGDRIQNTAGTHSAWDFNYKTFDFSPFASNAISDTSSDACYIRCVEE